MNMFVKALSFVCLYSLMSILMVEARGLGSLDEDERLSLPVDLNQAMKYLFKLDRYYAPEGYPRSMGVSLRRTSNKREAETKPLGRFLELQGLDNHLSQMSRPRFGKRGDQGYLESNYNILSPIA
eukprot:TRINITY_DN1181_c0_g1_i2.p1 TRINITY_DN1181_c0_g1~~TRINITY_DN1181_c0_g1_i2.p1  ORF type:complete len:125 (-),score=14.28 TRINITY_DN1181_c0_g1_i2:203-577(-)